MTMHPTMLADDRRRAGWSVEQAADPHLEVDRVDGTMGGTEMEDGYPVGQVNLVVADLDRSRKFYERLGWRFEEMGEQALMAEVPGGLLVALHLQAFAPTWNEGYDGDTGGAEVLDIFLPDRESVDRLHAEFTSEGHRSPQVPVDAFWGPRYAIVEDPDGYLVGLKSPR
jgi:catechol 2,3-dioxygenase-like lactoylglutathione lyase family enzyme